MKKYIDIKLFVLLILFLFPVIFLTGCEENAEGDDPVTLAPETQVVPQIQIEYNTSALDCLNYEIKDGVLYAYGNDGFGFFKEVLADIDEPIIVDEKNKVLHVEATGGVVMYLTADGDVFGFGFTEGGVLGEPQKYTDEMIKEPKLLFSDCKYASLGDRFILFIKNDNSLWFLGESKNGQSTKVEDAYTEPIKIRENVRFTKAFGYTSAWVDCDDNLYLCGDNSYGQIGNGKMGCGFPTLYRDIVSDPYLALANCDSLTIEMAMEGRTIVIAKTTYGSKYIWGGDYGPVPSMI